MTNGHWGIINHRLDAVESKAVIKVLEVQWLRNARSHLVDGV